jgi:hypothetical protein
MQAQIASAEERRDVEKYRTVVMKETAASTFLEDYAVSLASGTKERLIRFLRLSARVSVTIRLSRPTDAPAASSSITAVPRPGQANKKSDAARLKPGMSVVQDV